MEAIYNLKIPISSLKDHQIYDYVYVMPSEFFQKYQDDIIKDGKDVKVNFNIVKSPTMLQVKLEIKGILLLICDRSLEEFEEEIDITDKIIFKFGEKAEVLDIGLEVILYETNKIDFENTLYEIIGLSVPPKKLHPSFREDEQEDDDEDQENSFLIYSSKDKNTEEEEIDPRWEALKKLKGK